LGLKNFGVKNAKFKPINDILVNGRKISGSAQTRRNNVVLQHGTLLLDVNIKKMFSLLKVPDEKIKDKLIEKAEERVTSLKRELRKEVNIEELSKVLQEGFENFFNVSFEEGTLTQEEGKLAEKFYEKYSSGEWIFKR
jgi:lipoate-protein ligase A